MSRLIKSITIPCTEGVAISQMVEGMVCVLGVVDSEHYIKVIYEYNEYFGDHMIDFYIISEGDIIPEYMIYVGHLLHHKDKYLLWNYTLS